jgi:hypothetical protein
MVQGTAPGFGMAFIHKVLESPAAKSRIAIAINRAQQLNPKKFGIPRMATALSRIDQYITSLKIQIPDETESEVEQ